MTLLILLKATVLIQLLLFLMLPTYITVTFVLSYGNNTTGMKNSVANGLYL